MNDRTISRESFGSQKDINIKRLNFIRTQRKIKKYFKIVNIEEEEEPYSKSDYEYNSKN